MRAGTSRAWTAAMIAALAVVAAAFLILPPMLVPEPSPSVPSVRTAAPTDVPTPELSVQPAPSVALSPYRSVTWTLTPFADADADIRDAVAAGTRVVAMGVSGEQVPTAWSSADGGESWQTAALPVGTPPVVGGLVGVGPVAVWDERVLALGVWVDPATSSSVIQRFALVSDDGGVTWQNRELEPAEVGLQSVAATADGFVGAGLDAISGTSGLWSSQDGATWIPLDPVGLPDDAVRGFAPLAGGPDGLLLAGATGNGRDDSHPAAWFSADGRTWQLTYEDPAASGRILQLFGGEAGYLGLGQSFGVVPGGQPAIWFSPDGRSWTTREFFDLAGLQIGSAAFNAAGVVMTAESLTTGAATMIRFLRGGSEEENDAEVPIVRPWLIGLADRFVAIGSCPEGSDCHGIVVAMGRPTE